MPNSDIWKSMTSLPHDVSISTYENHQETFDKFWEEWSAWNYLVIALQDIAQNPHDSPIAYVACDSMDEFQASIYNTLVGFYRIGFSSLRNVLEQIAIGANLSLTGDTSAFTDWIAGNIELNFGWAADNLRNQIAISSLENELNINTGDDLFHQKQPGRLGGLERRMFSELSSYTHSSPSFTNTDTWQSNGPVYVKKAVVRWSQMYRKVFLFAMIMLKAVEPRLYELAFDAGINIEQLYNKVLACLDMNEDGYQQLAAVSSDFWDEP